MKATGDCYEAAGNYLMRLGQEQRESHKLVHGVVSGTGPLEGRRFDHAWVETSAGPIIKVIDRSNGGNVVVSRMAYYLAGHVDPDECGYYTHREAMAEMTRTEHFGPWEDL